MTPVEPSVTPNPALSDLGVLVGGWEMELSGASFLPDPDTSVKGHADSEWNGRGVSRVYEMSFTGTVWKFWQCAEAPSHYSLLRTTEELLHLPLLGQAADARSMVGQFEL